MKTTTPRTNRLPRWGFIVVALLGGHVALMATAVTFALRGYGSAGVEPDYYARAVAWDADRDALERSEALGWTVTVTPDIWLDEHGRRSLSVSVHDAQGQPINDAHVALRMHHAIYPRQQADATLPARGAGTYTAKLPGLSAGLWRIDLRIETSDAQPTTWVGHFDQTIADVVALHRHDTLGTTQNSETP